MISLSTEVTKYRDRGRFVAVSPHKVFAFESEPAGRETLLLLHGFPTSSHDFAQLMQRLEERYRIVTLDYLGFGLSDKPEAFSYSLFEHADAVELVMRSFGTSHCHVIAHDVGTSVACELLARRERGLLTFDIDTVTLMNGSVHIEMSQLTPSQKLLLTPLSGIVSRIGSERVFRYQMRRLFGRHVSDADLGDMWALMSRAGGRARLPQTISYIPERHRFKDRWVGALERLDLPAHLLWGVLDPVAIFPIALKLEKEIPRAVLTRLEGIGHYPQVEAPDETAEALLRFLANTKERTNGAQ